MHTTAAPAPERALRVRIGHTALRDSPAAAQALAVQLAQPQIGLILLFVAYEHDLAGIAAILAQHFGDARIVGCATERALGPLGYARGACAALSIHRDDLRCQIGLYPALSTLDLRSGQLFAHRLKESLRQRYPDVRNDNSFALMLTDGHACQEDTVARAFYDGLSGTRIVGATVADVAHTRPARILFEGAEHHDAALLLVACTPFLFEVFKTQNFVGNAERMVVTGARAAQRIVTELNGCPAAEEYAAAIGLPVARLNAEVFAAHPLVVRLGDSDFVRAIQQANADGSLTFYCAIDEGLVFRLGQNLDLVSDLTHTLSDIAAHIGPPALVLGCDCLFRLFEMECSGATDAVADLLRAAHGVGFCSYGEQYCGMHINQTLTGIALSDRVRA